MNDGNANGCTPPLTWEQRDRMLFAAGQALAAEIGRGASPVVVRPLLDLLFLLATYKPAGKPPKPAGLPPGRPSKPLSLLFPTKAQQRSMAKRKRPAGAGQRGPLAGKPTYLARGEAEILQQMVRQMAAGSGREYAAAAAVLRHRGEPLAPEVIRRLARGYESRGYASDMPRYRLHHRLGEALKRGDMAGARALVDELQSLAERASVSLRPPIRAGLLA